jgi:hypothetical protein
MDIFEDKLKDIREGWGLIKEDELPAGSSMPQASTPQGEAPAVGEGNPGDEEEMEPIPHRSPDRAFVWMTGTGHYLVNAASEEDAYEKVIQHRMTSGQDRAEAEAWFDQEDRLEEIAGEI